jgi:hypothetical protein
LTPIVSMMWMTPYHATAILISQQQQRLDVN